MDKLKYCTSVLHSGFIVEKLWGYCSPQLIYQHVGAQKKISLNMALPCYGQGHHELVVCLFHCTTLCGSMEKHSG